MAPPANRRPGFSRRAQYSLFTGYVVAALGAVLGAGLLILSLIKPDAFAGLRGAASDVAAPVGETGAVGRTESQGIFEYLAGYIRAGSKNAQLREEMELARIRLAEAQAIEQENKRLKALLALDDGGTPPVARARLIGSTSSSTRRIAYISVGANDGIRVGMPVRSPRGLIGRVLETGAESARVLLLTDGESIVPVRRAKDNVVAFAEGRSDGTLRLRLVNLGINPLQRGDVFVTSGAGGLFQPGVAVAVVSEITKDGAIGRLLSDPAATDFVVVDPIWQPEAVAVANAPPKDPAP
ncbi:rod shape-determining protein MreC [Tsuneonella sp. CC-YZS046]|uniref:rod shape-determining protein MreC n=1 Tax=Tsuneonella sp. CC-YZS046 TaxID=3042152 RepID=UPI002D789962|nr:rod shape-determining protein MreC [Tsuneonella sp. CC-YZS046]WRO67667.1 rod shape-determining protein MreC [Tsuneonella sp. CC-YZS046]